MTKPKTDREMLQACLEAMEISQRGGGHSDWQYMIADVRKHLQDEPECNCGKLDCVPESEWEHADDCPAFHQNRSGES